MRRNWHWVTALGLSLALFAPAAALAQTTPSPDSAVIGNAHVVLGVSSDAGLAKAGTGLQFVPTRADGLANLCACSGWTLAVGAAPLVQTVEGFWFTTDVATSTVRVQDGAATQLRVTHDFHPALGATNLYEIVVDVENLGSAPVTPVYTRTVGWPAGLLDVSALPIDPARWTLQPTPTGLGLVFQTALPEIAPHATQVVRLYFGAGASVAEADAGLAALGGTLVSQTGVGTTMFVFGYAPGAAPLLASSGGTSSRGGGGGGGGGTSNGGGGGTSSGGGGGGGGGGDKHPNDASAPTHPSTEHPQDNPREDPSAPATATPIPAVTVVLLGDPGSPGSSDGSPTLNATPELDSLALMGSGLLGLGGYALSRLRARRPLQRGHERLDAEDQDQHA